ncbi:MAG: hypothetical protein CL402_07080 [Acidiferrobacteraceae bacterium]|nr:hypothetical protein [Acidiferrobacteraceae bacterium]|tara:strand:- start:12957 stop:13739 length:783 start_codon:yes stop_codon:yes gene_type:complete
MNILITGGLGWLGKAITEVISQHHEVCAFDLENPDVEREAIKFNGQTLMGSITDFDQVQEAVKGKDAIIHAAVASTVTRNQYADVSDVAPFDVNIRGTCNVLEAARREGISRVIQIASAETHVNHPTGHFLDGSAPYFGLATYYDLTKALQENICRWFAHHYNLEIALLRLGDIVDVGSGSAKKGEDSWNGSIDTDAWIDRYDAANACLKLLQHSFEGVEVFHLVGAPSALEKFDVGRTLQSLDLTITSDIDKRPASMRN